MSHEGQKDTVQLQIVLISSVGVAHPALVGPYLLACQDTKVLRPMSQWKQTQLRCADPQFEADCPAK